MPGKNIFVRLAIEKQNFRNEKGTTVVEFAVILPLLMLLIFGIIEFGLVFYNKAIITNAAREGARAGSVFQVDSDGNYNPMTRDEVISVVNNYLASHLVTFGSPTTATPNPTPCPQDFTLTTREITVEVPFTYTFLTLPNLSSLGSGSGFPLSINLTSTSVMRCE